jgi:AraC-like DNA-binding protein
MSPTLQRPKRPMRLGATSTIRAFFFWPLIKELHSSGLDTAELLESRGISHVDLRTPYAALPLAQYVALAEHAATTLKRPYLGLEIGQKFTLADLGPFYALFTLAADLKAALATLARYEKVWQTHTSLEIVRGHKTSICRYSIADPNIWPRKQDAEFALVSYCMIIRHLTSNRWAPSRVQFEHPVGSRAPRLKRFFRAPVGGGASANILTISNEDMDRPLRWGMGPHDATLLPILERHLLDLVSSETVETQIISERTSLHIARTLGHGTLSVETTAARFGMSSRNLRRRLANEGTSFRQLLQIQRRTKIEAILSDGGIPLTTLAGWLSYSDGAVLSRAFKGWTGISPAHYSKARAARDTDLS